MSDSKLDFFFQPSEFYFYSKLDFLVFFHLLSFWFLLFVAAVAVALLLLLLLLLFVVAETDDV